MKKYLLLIFVLFIFNICLQAQEANVDVLLEKVQKSKTKEEKEAFLSELKLQLAKANKKTREESNAIIKAKKKLPSKPFKVK